MNNIRRRRRQSLEEFLLSFGEFGRVFGSLREFGIVFESLGELRKVLESLEEFGGVLTESGRV